MQPLRIIFMGTAGFAVPSLERLVAEGLAPVAVATGPDRRRGRGQKISFTPVKTAAHAAGIQTILQPENVKDPEFAEEVGNRILAKIIKKAGIDLEDPAVKPQDSTVLPAVDPQPVFPLFSGAW